MDIHTVTSFRRARTRADLALAPGETFLAGGTWLLSEPQPQVTGFVDLTTLGWPDIEADAGGLRIAATCTIARLVRWAREEAPGDWPAARVIPDAADALLASFKIWHTATVGGNICRAFAAAAMVSLTVGLGAAAEVWTAEGAVRRVPVADLVTGNGANGLGRGDVLRAVEIPAASLRSRFALRKIALAEYGRSGAVVTGRADGDGSAVFTITAATERPTVLRFARMPADAELRAAVAAASGYYSDPLGAADWRRGVSAVLAARVRSEIAA